ncbi:hypothetical protein GCAAIG_08600 [Candidatus Electronema halotolerans]
MQSRNFFYSVQAAALSVLLFSPPAFAQSKAANAPDSFFVYGVIVFFLFVLFYTLRNIKNALASGKSEWSLSDALSEPVEVTNKDSENKEKIVEMRASSSRLVAFMGMIAILVLFIGFGTFALYRFAVSGELGEDADKVVTFLTAGLTLFAPYAVNKASKVFESIKPS